MTPTPVGMRCPECAGQRTRVVRVRALNPGVPYVTYALLAINVLFYLAEQGQFTISGSGLHGWVVDHLLLSRGTISVWHDFWRLLGYGFVHENRRHIGFNMYLLYVLGMMLEPAIGSVRFGAVYLTSLLAGALGALIATPAPTIGASGAIFGLMGVAVVELRARNISVMQSGIGALIIINLIFSFTFANISVGAHVAGLVGGLLAGAALKEGDRHRSQLLGLAGCVVLSALAVAGALLVASSTSTGIAL